MPGDGTYTRYGDELKLHRVAGCGEAAGVLLENRHPQGQGDALQTESIVQSPAGMTGVAAGLMDDLRHSIQVYVLPGERSETGFHSVGRSFSESVCVGNMLWNCRTVCGKHSFPRKRPYKQDAMQDAWR